MMMQPAVETCPYCGKPAGEAVSGSIGPCANCGAIRTAARDPANLGTALDEAAPFCVGGLLRERYRILGGLGRGAHGTTFYARNLFLDHACVVKVERQGKDPEAEARRRIRTEVRVGLSIDDPYLVRVFDCDVADSRTYFVMEYVAGADLGAVIDYGQRVPWRQGVRIALDVARGLRALHRNGLVHRDIKPSNLILGADGKTRVADLGLVARPDDVEARTGSYVAGRAGTLTYTAPEVFTSQGSSGPAADLYSLGSTLFHLLTGRLPHETRGIFQRLLDIQNRPVRWPLEEVSDVPPWLIDTVLVLLEIEPRRRFGSAADLVEHIGRLAREDPQLARLLDADERAAEEYSPEILRPRGVVVRPLAVEADSKAGEDWLGLSLATYLSRGLARTPGALVADTDGYEAVLRGLGANTPGAELEAARLIGAATVVTGRFRTDGEQLFAALDVERADLGPTRDVALVQGPFGELARLEELLFERLLRWLDLAEVDAAALRQISSPALAAREAFTRGKQAYLRGDYETAVGLAARATELAPEFAEAFGLAGVCLARLGRYEDAAEQHRRQSAAAEMRADPRLQVEAAANLGVMNYFRGEYETAEGFYDAAARLAQELGFAVELAQIQNNRGFVLYRLGRLEEAAAAFGEAIEGHRAMGALLSLIGPYNGLGNVLVEQKRYAEARGFYHRARALAEESGDRTNIGTACMHLGRCAALAGNVDEAKRELATALQILEETRFWNGLARVYEYLGELNTQLGNHEETVRCADQRIALARQHTNARVVRAAMQQKSVALRALGRFKEADACEEGVGGLQASCVV